MLISVTTIPAAANIGVAAAYGDCDGWPGSLAQLALNLVSIVVAGTLVLAVQRMLYARRWRNRRGSARAERRPDVDLGADLLDHRVGELAWSSRAPPRSIVFVPVAIVSSTPS